MSEAKKPTGGKGKRHEDLRIPATPDALAKAVTRSLHPPVPKPKAVPQPRQPK